MTVALILFYIAIVVTVAIIIINTDTTSKALAYLMLISFFPLLGLVVYFSIGQNYRINKMYSKKLAVDRTSFPTIERGLKEYSQRTLDKLKDQLKNFYNLAKFNHIDHILTSDNTLELLINGEEKFPSILEAMENAEHHIHIEYYIFENDVIGDKVGHILSKKAKEGVEVRFIYDDFGSKSIRKSFVKSLRECGVEAFPFYKIKLTAFANRLNYRNHRKIIVVDGKVGYVGGINISERYTNPNSHKLYWRDTHLKITGSTVLSLQKVFMADWNFCAQQDLEVNEEYFPISSEVEEKHDQLAQIVYSGPDSDYPSIMYALIQAVILAKKEVLITTPYFVPDTSFINAIKIARLSGVDIKLLLPGISDSFIVNATSNSYCQELLEVGVEVYKYQKGFVHAKTMVCDGFMSTVGTANLDQRSFDLNFEINALIYDEKFSTQLRNSFFKDLEDSKQINLEDWKNRPMHIRFFERVMRLVSPLM